MRAPARTCVSHPSAWNPSAWAPLALACSLVFACAACAGPAQLRYEAALEEAPPAATHAIHDARLRQLMQSLDRLRKERLPKALDVAREEQRSAMQVAQVARAMAESAPRIAAAIPEPLAPDDRAAFLEIANMLERQASSLAAEATTLTPSQRGERLAQIDATCEACHGRYRIPEPSRDGS